LPDTPKFFDTANRVPDAIRRAVAALAAIPQLWPPGSTADRNCPPRESSLSGWIVTRPCSHFTNGFQPTRLLRGRALHLDLRDKTTAALILDHDAQPAMRISTIWNSRPLRLVVKAHRALNTGKRGMMGEGGRREGAKGSPCPGFHQNFNLHGALLESENLIF
jgi:hypothetical protein